MKKITKNSSCLKTLQVANSFFINCLFFGLTIDLKKKKKHILSTFKYVSQHHNLLGGLRSRIFSSGGGGGAVFYFDLLIRVESRRPVLLKRGFLEHSFLGKEFFFTSHQGKFWKGLKVAGLSSNCNRTAKECWYACDCYWRSVDKSESWYAYDCYWRSVVKGESCYAYDCYWRLVVANNNKSQILTCWLILLVTQSSIFGP